MLTNIVMYVKVIWNAILTLQQSRPKVKRENLETGNFGKE